MKENNRTELLNVHNPRWGFVRSARDTLLPSFGGLPLLKDGSEVISLVISSSFLPFRQLNTTDSGGHRTAGYCPLHLFRM